MLWLLFALPTVLAAGKQGFIVGGEDVDIADYPHQGSYRQLGNHICGCVLVAEGWAVTAAHCGGTAAFSTRWGSTLRSEGDEGLVVGVAEVITHPNYDDDTPGAFPNDIALVRLDDPAVGDNIAAISLGSERLEGGEDATITGWGRTCGLCGLPEPLQGADLDVLTDAEASAIWGDNYNGDVHVCVKDIEDEDKGACNGDSGGPMESGGVLHGITSWGAVGCPTTAASSYTRVTQFRDWLCETSEGEAEGC